MGHGILVPHAPDALERFEASMGPCLWGTEYESFHLGCLNVIIASMGPCLWGTEYHLGDLRAGCIRHCFNGAVPLGHGIPLYRRADDGLIRVGLQWGRAFGARNTVLTLSRFTEVDALQWGRAFGARNTPGSNLLISPMLGFNGAVPLGHGIQ